MAKSLTQLAAKPQLVKITLDDVEIINKYEDALEFWIYDRQPIDQFIKFATASQNDQAEMIRMVNALVLDEQGQHVLKDGEALPNDVMLAVIGAVIERLGK